MVDTVVLVPLTWLNSGKPLHSYPFYSIIWQN